MRAQLGGIGGVGDVAHAQDRSWADDAAHQAPVAALADEARQEGVGGRVCRLRAVAQVARDGAHEDEEIQVGAGIHLAQQDAALDFWSGNVLPICKSRLGEPRVSDDGRAVDDAANLGKLRENGATGL